MIGLLLITHATYGESLIQCACHVLNQRPGQVAQLGISAHDDPAGALQLAQDMLKRIDTGEGVLVLTDIYGATPSNIACKLLKAGRIEGVAGVNLPMLLRALTSREEGMENLLERTVSGGREGVMNMLKC